MIVLLLIIFLALPLCLAHQHVAEFAHPGALAVAMETGFTADPVRNHGNRTLVRLRGRGDWRVARKHAMWIETQEMIKFQKRDAWETPVDAQYSQQWFLNGDKLGGVTPRAHANIAPVWAQGWFGQGVLLLVVDDGVFVEHPDLAANYDGPAHSFNYFFNSKNINARNGIRNHGTPVASTCCGVNNAAVGMSGQNECGVGSAPKSRFAVVTDLDVVSDADTAEVLAHDSNAIDIYILTAGATDNGRTIQSVRRMTDQALMNGVNTGRKNGKGSIFVWAAGNGGKEGDDCNFDGFVSHRATIGVGAITAEGKNTYYSERCSCQLVVAPSSGAFQRSRGGVSGMMSGANPGCNDNWGGTSGSAPLAAGIIAVWLSARPSLSWLDVQGILVYSSSKEMVHPDQQASFQTNGVGIAFSHWFGFGVIDGEKGFEVLKQWQSYDVNSLQSVDSGEIRVDRVITTPVTVGDNDGDYTESDWVNNQGDNKATKWVEVTVVISHQRRGDVQVELLSPSGTLSVLAHPRPNDSGRNFNYKFTTVANWDENPKGKWKLRVKDTQLSPANGGKIVSWRIEVYFTNPNVFSNPQTRPVNVKGNAISPQSSDKMQGQNNNNNNTQEPGFIADEANNNTIAAGATQSTSSESSSEFDATLGTGIEGLLYVIVGGALCVVGVTVLIGVVVVSRRKKRRKHRSQTEFSIGIDVDNDAARNVGVAKVRAIADNGGETVGGYDIAPPLGSNDVNGNDVAIPTLRHTELPPSPRPQYDSSKFPIGQAPNDRPLPSFM